MDKSFCDKFFLCTKSEFTFKVKKDSSTFNSIHSIINCSSTHFVFQLLPEGFECRPTNGNECDLPEYCNGYTGECPRNLYVKNTVPCNDGNGYCINGMCPTMDQQCQMLWGRTSQKADDQCFEKFNSKGTQTGNCGKTQFNSFKQCAME